ncbi:adenosylcobyric acid synthase [Jeotgalibaca sp. PTS2502]|uniref:Lipid II isoglutaminyl synthase (glutamine-hydrolyzing) subunit GatD n=1 Tax=Jeotgalibaca arthritidis TaxID=1868794 RepID=A0A6G7K780_9LACT|nr:MULTISPECIES: adenosylcobyric acid synthase [Jeotgalibaca]APZ48533.1 adenosylcobyric acid synthase [Jeotgalibaca sp. PTS2502]QII81112.1 adenosylcobyric acid synthase [Jeotgalibaca arthritidis]
MKLRIGHLYGNLLNTYGDNGNLLMLQYCAKQRGVQVETDIVSLNQPFNPNDYDLVFFGGGQDYEQYIVSKDIQAKADAIKTYIDNDGVLLAICGGYQLLGHYYVDAKGKKISGISAIDYYTLNQDNNRFIGDITIVDEETGDTYNGFENHNGRTFLGDGVQPLGIVQVGKGNNGEDKTEGARYKNVFCSYFHGPLLVRNNHLAERIVDLAIKNHQKKNLLA